MRKLFKWSGIIVGGLVLLLVVLAIADSGDKEPPQAATVPQSPTVASVATTSPTTAPVKSLDTPSNKPAPKPTATPSVPQVGHALQLADGLLFMVEAVERQEGLLFVTVLLDNSIGTKSVAVSSLMSFSVKDSDGNVADYSLSANRNNKAPDGEILAGDKLRGTLAYKTANLTAEPVLYYQASLLASPIKISLQQ